VVLALASCSAGGATESAPTTTIPAAIAIANTVPGARPLPTTLREPARPSLCPDALPANFPQRGVARLDISLVGIAAVEADVCRYEPSPASTGLPSRVEFDGAAATTIADALNSVAGIDPLSGPRCEPGPTASVVVAISDGLRVEEFLVSLAGCRGVSNGLLSGAGTALSTAVLQRAVTLAELCDSRFPFYDGCAAVGP